jgi:hypothetical protein
MLGSPDAEDMTQEIRARLVCAEIGQPGFGATLPISHCDKRLSPRARRRKRERRLWGDPVPMVVGAELGLPDLDVDWLEPMPNSVISDVADVGRNPQASYEQAEPCGWLFWLASNSAGAAKGDLPVARRARGRAPPRLGPLAMSPQAANSRCNGRGARSMPPISEPKMGCGQRFDKQVAERYAATRETRP